MQSAELCLTGSISRELLNLVLRGFLWSWSPKTDSSLPRRPKVRLIHFKINMLLISDLLKVTFLIH